MTDTADISNETPLAAPALDNPTDGRAKPRTPAQLAAIEKARLRKHELTLEKRRLVADAKAEKWAEKKKDQELGKIRRLYRDTLRKLDPVEGEGEVLDTADMVEVGPPARPAAPVLKEKMAPDECDLAERIISRLDENFFSKYVVKQPPTPPVVAESKPKKPPTLPPNRPTPPPRPVPKYVFL
jgi:hypothetical protein